MKAAQYNKQYYKSPVDPLGIKPGGWSIYNVISFEWPRQVSWAYRPRGHSAPSSQGPEAPVVQHLGHRFCARAAWNITIVLDTSIDPWRLKIERATECRLNPCVRTRTLRTKNSSTTSEVTRTDHGAFSYLDIRGMNGPKTWMEFGGQRAAPDVNHSEYMRSYSLSEDARIKQGRPRFASAMRELIGGEILAEVKTECLWARMGRLPSPNVSSLVDDGRLCAMSYLNDSDTTPVLRTNLTVGSSFDVIVANGGIEWLFPRVADFFTAALRSTSNDMVYGRSYSSERYTEVRWVWFLVPRSIVGLGVIFLLTTIWITRSSRDPLWRTSGIPMFDLRQERDGEEEREQEEDLHETSRQDTSAGCITLTSKLLGAMEKEAKHERVSLRVDDETGGLRLRITGKAVPTEV